MEVMKMNKQFVSKMLQAKRLEYEAFREILPESLARRVENLERKLVNIVRECLEIILCYQPDVTASGTKAGIRKISIEQEEGQ